MIGMRGEKTFGLEPSPELKVRRVRNWVVVVIGLLIDRSLGVVCQAEGTA